MLPPCLTGANYNDNRNRIERWYANMGELMDASNPADAGGDLDGDGYTNLQAYVNGWDLTTNRQQYDFDGDRITDAQEDYWNGLHPGSLDKTRFADAVADFDEDGLFNYEELQLGTNLADAHSLHLLLTDGQVQTWQRGIAIPGRYGYDPADPAVPLPAPAAHSTWDDLDNDGIPDGFANFSATISGGIPARAVDPVDEDQDGMNNVFEHLHHLNPRDASDAGLAGGLILHPPAYADAAGHLLALRQDPDEDGLSNRREAQMKTHPRHPDTDGDGHADGTESEAGSNPTQPGSTPPPGSTGPGGGPGSGSTNPGPFANPGLKPAWQPSPSTSVQDGYKIGLVERRRKVTPEVFHHGGMTADPVTGEGWEPAVTEVRVFLQPSEGLSAEAEQLAHWVGGGWAGWSEEQKAQFNQDVDTAYASVNGAALPDWSELPETELLAGGGVISWAGFLDGIEIHKAEYRLERRSIPGQPAPVDAEGNVIRPEVRRTFLKVKEILAPPPTGGPPQRTQSMVGTVEFVIAEGQDVSGHTELLAAPDFKAGEVGMSLLPIDIKEVWEKDQKWNKAPNPKRPQYQAIIRAENPEPAEEHYKRLYVATEPENGKAEITVQLTSGISLGSTKILACVETNGTIVEEFAEFDSSDKADLAFIAAGSVHSDTYNIRIGIDKNSNGALSSDELIPLPTGVNEYPFTLKVVQADNITNARTLLVTASAAAGGLAGSYVNVFLGTRSDLQEATSNPDKQSSITDEPPTMIAGSPYEQTSGTTAIPSFHLADGTTASDLMENHFSRQPQKGLHKLVYDIWKDNASNIWNHFQGSSDLEKSFTYSVVANENVDFYYNGTNPLRLSYGAASCKSGSITLHMKRDGNKILTKEITINATIEDVYDFDFTRPQGSFSRMGAVIQIGWESPSRMGGRIFHSEIDVDVIYTESTTYQERPQPIDFFNAQGYIENGSIVTPSGGGDPGNGEGGV